MTSMLKTLAAERQTPKTPPLPPDTQRVCIDLPGEEFRCYVHKPKVQVMLRKHRDVIFELQLFKGMTYTVEAERTDFYNARDKKLVEHRKKHSVSFKDGERLHLWVGRQFEGALVLKAAGKVIGRYEPNKLDPVRYDAEPGTKAAPLIIVMKNQPEAAPTAAQTSAPAVCKADDAFMNWTLKPALNAYGLDNLTLYSRERPSTPLPEQHATVAVVDGDDKGMPQELFDYFASGGGKSGLADVDTNEVATRNWLLGQLAGTAMYARDNWNWLRHAINRQADGTFKLVSAKVAYVRGKVRIYFAGYSANNPVFGPGGHGPGNAKILQIYAGVGQMASSFKATAQAVAGSFKGNAVISFIFGSATSWAEWKADAQKDGYDFAAALLTGVVKTLLAAAITAAVMAVALLVLMGFLEIAVAALVVGGITVAAGFVINYFVETGDKALGKKLQGPSSSDGTAAAVAPWLRSAGQWVKETLNYLSDKFPKDYQPWAAL